MDKEVTKSQAELLMEIKPSERMRRKEETFDEYRNRVDPKSKIKENKLLTIYLKGYPIDNV